jgi:hypothetical protein
MGWGSKGIRRVAVGGAVAVALVAGAAGVGGAGPADDRFDAITGPLASTVVYPEQFGMDPSAVVVDPTSLLGSVDRDRAMAFVESLSFPRTAAGPESARQQARDLVAAGLTDAGYEPVLQSVVRNGIDSPNIYAELPGTDCPSRVFVIGGHYDSAVVGGPGADDNATGVAGMLEIARALREHPLPITVRFASWSYEEVGLVGAFEMARTLAAEDADVVGAVSLEMIGYTEDDIDPLTGLPGDYLGMVADPSSASLARAFGAAAYHYTPEHPAFGAVIDPAVLGDILRSDHAAFLSQGFPALMATDTANFRNENYHTVNDTPESLDPEFMAGNIRTMLAGLVTFAASDQNEDGRADLCGAAAPTTTVTLPIGSEDPPDDSGTPAAPGADALRGRSSYTG